MQQNKFEKNILMPLLHSLAADVDRQAFFIGGRGYAYGALAQRISAIRQYLQNKERGSKVIALALNDDIDTYAAILAIWMEGCAYVPLHPLQPVSRNMDIIRQTETDCLLYTNAGAELVGEAERSGLTAVDVAGLSYRQDILDGWAEASDEELAYILFTSGSTGTPKGVCITRGNLSAFIDSFWKTGIVIGPEDRCLQAFDLTFDVSIQAFLTGLLGGACVYTIPYGQVKYLYAASLIMEHQITCAAMAPSMLTYLRPYFDQFQAESLKTTILTAEACPLDLAEAWFGCAKNTEIYDFYGPTEATVYCTYYHLSRQGGNLSHNGVVAIGRPLANVTVIIIDEEGNPIQAGGKGELCVAGGQVTPGYWKNAEKNEQSFFLADTACGAKRYYHTGDLVELTEGGNILYCGRMDQQAKIQGYRVELGEVEYHVRQYYDGQKRVVAAAFNNKMGLTEIALFVEAATCEKEALTQYLGEHLPHYMVPSRIICVEAFPLNRSEKIDRPALLRQLSE